MWELIKYEHCLPSDRIPFCSRIFKSEQASKFYKTMLDDFIVYLGFGLGEWRRMQRSVARLDVQDIKSEYPLLKQNLTDSKIKDVIRNEWKICLPEPYLYLNHNNCLPCFKGGKKHFYQIWKYYPDYFKKAIESELLIGNTVFKDTSLTELDKVWTQQKPLFSDDDFDMRPCMCAL